MLVNRNVRVGDARTSMRLDPVHWEALADVCRREKINTADLIAQAQRAAPEAGRTEAVRGFLLNYFRRRVAA